MFHRISFLMFVASLLHFYFSVCFFFLYCCCFCSSTTSKGHHFCCRWCGSKVERWYHLILYIFVQMENNYVVLLLVKLDKFKSDAYRTTRKKTSQVRRMLFIHIRKPTDGVFPTNFTFMHIKSFPRNFCWMRVVTSNRDRNSDEHIQEYK